ncbi:MAG: sufD [Frankiales bacterium]|nr:sufD [Frankiales bacterium]
MASSDSATAMQVALSTERDALKATGGVMDGAIATNVKPSTPRRPAGESPADVRPERLRSADPDAFGVPTGREEEWRFTPLARVKPLFDAVPGAAAGLDARIEGEQDGVSFGPVADGDPLLDGLPLPADLLSARAASAPGSTTALRIDKAAELTEAVVVNLTATGDAVLFGHLVIEVGEQARATVVLDHTGDARYVGKTSVLLGDGASLDLVSVQSWGETAVHSEHLAFQVGRDARLRSTQVTLGGSLVRVLETVDFTGPGGDVELRGVSFADDGQHLEHRLLVDHSVPKCRSRVTYKSALQGDQAHTVWIGDVLIRAAAEGTDTYELNRNLLLTPEARADSVPNLEIETGEIAGAGHASATGRFDDEQLFYLQARGIPADVARRMVVRGFFAEVVESIGVPALEERLMATIETELERAFS